MDDKYIMDIIISTVREMFDLETMELSEVTGPNDIGDWDSIAQIRILLLLEREFGIKFDFEKIGTLSTLGDIFKAVKLAINER